MKISLFQITKHANYAILLCNFANFVIMQHSALNTEIINF